MRSGVIRCLLLSAICQVVGPALLFCLLFPSARCFPLPAPGTRECLAHPSMTSAPLRDMQRLVRHGNGQSGFPRAGAWGPTLFTSPSMAYKNQSCSAHSDPFFLPLLSLVDNVLLSILFFLVLLSPFSRYIRYSRHCIYLKVHTYTHIHNGFC